MSRLGCGTGAECLEIITRETSLKIDAVRRGIGLKYIYAALPRVSRTVPGDIFRFCNPADLKLNIRADLDWPSQCRDIYISVSVVTSIGRSLRKVIRRAHLHRLPIAAAHERVRPKA